MVLMGNGRLEELAAKRIEEQSDWLEKRRLSTLELVYQEEEETERELSTESEATAKKEPKDELKGDRWSGKQGTQDIR